MKSKSFIKPLLIILVAASFSTAWAADKTIGVIMTGNIPYYQEIHKAFIETMLNEGLFQKGKLDVILQTPASEPMSWTNAARKLVSIGSDIIVSYGTPATLTAVREASGIPVIFAAVYDPQAVGINGKNVTGISSRIPVAGVLKHLKDISGFSRLGVFYDNDEKDTLIQADEIKSLQGKFGFKAFLFNIDRKGNAAKSKDLNAIFLTTSCAAMICVDNIVGIARGLKIPTATMLGGGEGRGIVLTVTADPAEQGSEAAKRVIDVLKGAKPSSLPVGAPTKVDIIINLKEANELGLKIPFDLLTSASKVIK